MCSGGTMVGRSTQHLRVQGSILAARSFLLHPTTSPTRPVLLPERPASPAGRLTSGDAAAPAGGASNIVITLYTHVAALQPLFPTPDCCCPASRVRSYASRAFIYLSRARIYLSPAPGRCSASLSDVLVVMLCW